MQLTAANIDLDKSTGILGERLFNAERYFTEQKEKIESQEFSNGLQSKELAEGKNQLNSPYRKTNGAKRGGGEDAKEIGGRV